MLAAVLAVVVAGCAAERGGDNRRSGNAEKTAEIINYFLVRSRWTTARMEREMGEAKDLNNALAKARRLTNELKSQMFDSKGLPPEFRQAYLEYLQNTNEVLDFVASVPQDGVGLVGFGLANLLDSGKTAEQLRQKGEAVAARVRKSTAAMEQIASRLGARTDWETLPRIEQVTAGSHAERVGLRPGDFLYTIAGEKLFRRVPKDVLQTAANGRKSIVVEALSDTGLKKFEIPAGEPIDVDLDLTGAEPTVMVRLASFAFFQGYYVNVVNYSNDADLEDVTVEFRDSTGGVRSQFIGILRAKTSHRLDPSTISWTVARGQTINILARGRVPRVYPTDRLIP